MNSKHAGPPDVVLVSMPWALANMPSVQLGALAAYLEGYGVRTSCVHWYLEVACSLGFGPYTEFAQARLEDGEIVYGCLLFPEIRERMLADREFRDRAAMLAGSNEPAALASFLDRFALLHDTLLRRYDWSRVRVVGFTLNFSQTLGSLYLARKIKRINPAITVIVGGAEATGLLGESLVENFPQIDFACNGEGERPLLELAKARASGGLVDTIAGLTGRRSDGGVFSNAPDQFSSLESLPRPQFDDYFLQLRNLGLSPHLLEVVLPMEGSRGCYYNCSFCALNIQWGRGIRARPAASLKTHIEESVREYAIHDIFFVDNVIPPGGEELFRSLSDSPSKIRFFYEIRANTPVDTLYWMQKAGCKRVQIGIEALSSDLLTLLDKKSRTIHNLQCLKFCEIFDIDVSANLILGHPGTEGEHVAQTYHNIDYALGYKPPTEFSGFDMQFGSPDYNTSLHNGNILGNSPKYSDMFPAALLSKLFLPSKQFVHRSAGVDWAPVRAKVEKWRILYKQSKKSGQNALTCFLAEDHIKIDDRRFQHRSVYILRGLEKDLYIYLGLARRLPSIYARFSGHSRATLDQVLLNLSDAKLLFGEDGQYLSLAVPDRAHRDSFLKTLGIPSTFNNPKLRNSSAQNYDVPRSQNITSLDNKI